MSLYKRIETRAKELMRERTGLDKAMVGDPAWVRFCEISSEEYRVLNDACLEEAEREICGSSFLETNAEPIRLHIRAERC